MLEVRAPGSGVAGHEQADCHVSIPMSVAVMDDGCRSVSVVVSFKFVAQVVRDVD